MNTEKTFSIKETVNKNIERVQFPSFNNHRTLIGIILLIIFRMGWYELSKGAYESTIYDQTKT